MPGRSTGSFTTSHLFGLGKVRGSFRIEDGLIRVTDPVGGSSARATIAAASVDTGNSARDSMLRSPTYLDTAAHPHITFASTRVEEIEGTWLLHGRLTVRARSGSVELWGGPGRDGRDLGPVDRELPDRPVRVRVYRDEGNDGQVADHAAGPRRGT
ncbi:polyisoprenoid-binding protein YceI [Saccharomonospora amisosensis]|uniref:Polyisoprenoid-binding protein YceI n=1 Tax=Saccharomonospora amisosensis TaxID=1128677 RepID=A0A7X5URK1_9PSEU|nr:YceI family protein [Saccharomonospora amisosensis]NIJ12434.1 polyisoprenoid-binding protein YceI [Saccharomonospora amisosensis]